MLGAQALAQMEPGLQGVSGGAAFFPDAVSLSDPGEMMQRLAGVVRARAGFVQARAEKLTRRYDGVVVEGQGLHVHARKVVIAAGAHSKALARQAGDTVPLDTELDWHDLAEEARRYVGALAGEDPEKYLEHTQPVEVNGQDGGKDD